MSFLANCVISAKSFLKLYCLYKCTKTVQICISITDLPGYPNVAEYGQVEMYHRIFLQKKRNKYLLHFPVQSVNYDL